MKKFLFSLLTLAAALTVASCQKELQAGPNGEGPAVNASFAVSLGDAMTKAFADGTTVDKVYAALYEVGSDGAYTFVAEADPAEITDLKATVQINGKLKKGKSYRVAFWAQKAAEAAAEGSTAAPAASAYKVVWDPAPVVTVTPTGAANDEARDAFYGVYDTGEVKGNITAEKVIPLVRPFAQVNVLVPVGNLSADAAITSSMTIKQAPTTLNLNTGETGTPADYVFATAPMAERAFGTYAQTHKYVAMNYVLVDQAAQNHYHDVEFSVTAGDDNTGETPKSLNVPLKSNVRTNIVGNIFESFGFNGTVVVTPEGSEVEATDIRIAVGTAGTSADAPIDVTANGTLVTFAISRSVDSETPVITYKKGGVVTATWDPASNGINIVPVQGVENGSDVVTVTFPEVTKTTYAEGKVDVYVKVGTGEDPVVEQVATPTFTPAAGEYTEAQNVTISCATEGAAISYKLGDGEWQSYSAAISVNENVTISAKATKEGMTDSEVATAAYTINISATPDFTTVAGLKALLGAESASFTGTLTNAVVSFIAGTSDAVIKDASGSILYHKEGGHGLLQGKTISGDVVAEGVIYNGINEITNLTATVEGEESAVEPEVVTFAQLAANYAKYESAYVKVVGVTSKTTTTKKGNITATQDATDYIVYTNVAIPVNTGDIFTAEGTVTKYNTTEEIKVWKAADLTVTTAVPTLSATPASTTVKATATSVTWTITSNTEWTITPGTGVTASVTSGNGNADVTLTFAANTGSSAVTYTATASATGCDDVTITITQSAAGSSSDITDTITSALLTATSTTYTDFSNVAATSSARYAGNSAKSSSGGIQMRSKNSNSGIVSTVSGGRVKSVTITVESGTSTIDVYGSNTAYTGAGDLYATGAGGNQGTKIGSLNATGTITFTEDYAYVGIRSNNGTVYVTSIEIVWE